MTVRFVLSGLQALDANANPYSGALLYAYQAGTTTPQDTYSDSALSVANANPVVADSAGRFGDIFLSSTTYKFVLQDSGGSTIVTWDNYDAAFTVAEASQAQVDARTATGVYLSPAKVAGGLGLQGSSLAAAAAITLPAVGDYFSITGTGVSIASISTRSAGRRLSLKFAAANTLTNSASLICPEAQDLSVAAGDVVELVSEGSGMWSVMPTVSSLSIARLTEDTSPDTANDFVLSYDASASLPKKVHPSKLGTVLTTGTQCVLNPFATSSHQSTAHGLGAVPTMIVSKLVNLTAELGYSVGDEVVFEATSSRYSTSDQSASVTGDATNVTIAIGDGSLTWAIAKKDGTGSASITAANWKVVATPYLIG